MALSSPSWKHHRMNFSCSPHPTAMARHAQTAWVSREHEGIFGVTAPASAPPPLPAPNVTAAASVVISAAAAGFPTTSAASASPSPTSPPLIPLPSQPSCPAPGLSPGSR